MQKIGFKIGAGGDAADLRQALNRRPRSGRDGPRGKGCRLNCKWDWRFIAVGFYALE